MKSFKQRYSLLFFLSSISILTFSPHGFTQSLNGKSFILKPEIKFEHLTIAEGLSNSMVYSMAADEKGYMWFGTVNGLNRYDGYNFTVYNHDPQNKNSLGNNSIHAVAQDQKGKLWVGTLNGLNLFNPSTETAIRYYHQPEVSGSLSNNYINHRAIIIDRAGIVWIGTRDGLNQFIPQTNKFTAFKHSNDSKSLSHNNVLSIFQDSGSTLWIGTEKGLNRKMPGQDSFLTPEIDPDLQPSTSWGEIYSMGEDNLGYLWVGTYSGIYKRHPKTGKFEFYKDINIHITSMVKDSKGVLWFGS
jgi:ligand-binding sensor domain-containing protein